MASHDSFHPDYELVRELGRGGAGTVLLARNRLLDRLEVLKVPAPEMLRRSGMRERFVREMQSAARLNHPNVVTAYAVLTLPAGPALAMEFVDGPDLAQLVGEKGRLSVPRACGYAVHVLRGLGHAYEHGLVHRDVKPANLMVATVDGKPVVKVLDFGLAKAASEDGCTALTAHGDVIGTPDYMAPEQAVNPSTADIRADLYAVGCCLYFLLTGCPPFPRPTLLATLDAHRSDQPPPLEGIRDDLPAGLTTVMAHLLAKRTNDRYPTPHAAEEALAPFARRTTTGSGTKPVLELPRPDTIVGRPHGLPMPARTAYLNAEDFAAVTRPVPPKRRGVRTGAPPAWLTPAIIGGSAFFALAAVLVVGLLWALSPNRPAPQPVAGLDQTTPETPPPVVPPPVVATVAPQPAPHPAGLPADWQAARFRPLFDGSALTGWTPEAVAPGRWSVANGVLVGQAGSNSLLIYQQGLYTDVHVKARVRVAAGGNGGVCVRCPPAATANSGYLAQINAIDANQDKTGSLFREKLLAVRAANVAQPNGWFDLDLIAVGDRVEVRVNGRITAVYTDPSRQFGGGQIALQASTEVPVEFAAVAVREMPPARPPALDPITAPELTARIRGARLVFSYDPSRSEQGKWSDCRLNARTGVYPVGVEPRANHLRAGKVGTFDQLVVDCPAQPPPEGYRLFVFKTEADTVPVLLTEAQAFALPRGTWPARLRVVVESPTKRVVTAIQPHH